MKTIEVDARGEQCPIPMIKAKKALEELGGAGTVQIRVCLLYTSCQYHQDGKIENILDHVAHF